MKRFLDIVCAALGLIVLLPLLCPLAILLRMTGEGKVFYRQERMGFGSKPFFILKFATMLENSPSLGSGDITLKNDPRVLPVGRVLRKTKINELPQLWNVLIGEMSLVGPRPLTLNQFGLYSADTAAVIAKAKPGITGVSALVFRDEERFLAGLANPREYYSQVLLPRKARLESWYSENRTFLIDVTVLLLTACVVLKPSTRIAETWVHNASGVGVADLYDGTQTTDASKDR